MKYPISSFVFATIFLFAAFTAAAQSNTILGYANFDYRHKEGYGISGGLAHQYSEKSAVGVNYSWIYTNNGNGRFVSHYNAAGVFMRLKKKIGKGKTFFWYMQPEVIGFWSNAVDHRLNGTYHIRDRGAAAGTSFGIGVNVGRGIAVNLDPVYVQFAMGRILTEPSGSLYSYGDFGLRVSPRIGLSFNARYKQKSSTEPTGGNKKSQ